MITVSDLQFSYRGGDFKLRIPQLTINEGSTVAVVGPSGTGKTTLLNLVAGVLLPTAGRVFVGDVEVSGLGDGPRRRFRITTIGMIFQEFELLSYLNVLDNILLPHRINSALVLDADVRDRAVRLADEVGIADKLKRKVGQLSQGERQRVAVCRALLTRPDLILADEPTGNLDPANKGRVLDILMDYVDRNKTTLVTVTHDHDLLQNFERTIQFAEFYDENADSISPREQEPDGGGK